MCDIYNKISEKLQLESESIGFIYNFTCPQIAQTPGY